MNLHMTTPYYTKIDVQEEIRCAMQHIDNALNKSGVAGSKPITPIQALRLKDAHEALRKSLVEY